MFFCFFPSFFFNFDLSSLSYSTLSSFHILPQYNITLTEKKHFLCCLSVYITFIKMHIYPNSSRRKKKTMHMYFIVTCCVSLPALQALKHLSSTQQLVRQYTPMQLQLLLVLFYSMVHLLLPAGCCYVTQQLLLCLRIIILLDVGTIYTEIYMQTIHILHPSPCMYICRYIRTAQLQFCRHKSSYNIQLETFHQLCVRCETVRTWALFL